MAVVLTIAGSTKNFDLGSLHIGYSVNGRSTASFDVLSQDGTYRPALDAEVILTENGTRIFGGLVDHPREAGRLGERTGAYEGIVTSVSAVDFHHYTERRFVNGLISAGTMKAGLQTLVGYLSGYGVTLHASQVDGPTFPELDYDYRSLTEVLNEFAELTAKYGDPYIWSIDHFKVLRMYQPSTAAAPFDVSQGDGKTVGDLTVETTREQYANTIILKVPAKSETGRVETFIGDGTTTTFPLEYTLTTMRYVVDVDGSSELATAQGIGFDKAVQWLYDAEDNSYQRVLSGVPDPPADGAVISITFDGTLEASAVTAVDAGEVGTYGIWEKVITVEKIPSDTTAQALADAALAKAIALPKTVVYQTRQADLIPGQTQTITWALRNLSAVAGVITEVVLRDDGKGDRLLRTVTWTSGTTPKETHSEVYKVWAGDKTGNSVPAEQTIGDGGTVSSGPAPPLKSVQYNSDNQFRGNAAFLFDQDFLTLLLGTDHTAGGSINLLIGDGHTVI